MRDPLRPGHDPRHTPGMSTPRARQRTMRGLRQVWLLSTLELVGAVIGMVHKPHWSWIPPGLLALVAIGAGVIAFLRNRVPERYGDTMIWFSIAAFATFFALMAFGFPHRFA